MNVGENVVIESLRDTTKDVNDTRMTEKPPEANVPVRSPNNPMGTEKVSSYFFVM